MRSNFSLLQSELMEHDKLLRFFGKLPRDIKKLVQTFHKSKRPVLACHECSKRYYQISCFHDWIPYCVYHSAFPVHPEYVIEVAKKV